MPSMFGGSNTDPDYAPHMWLGDNFIHNTEKIFRIDEWVYRAGRLSDETLVVVRWKDGNREAVPADQIPDEIHTAMKDVSRAEQTAFQQEMQKKCNPSR